MTLTNYFGPSSNSMTATRIEGLMGNCLSWQTHYAIKYIQIYDDVLIAVLGTLSLLSDLKCTVFFLLP
jgi:hypothetical protein